MENSAGFNLENAIANWRRQLASSAIDRESLSELETHLRDSIASIQNRGEGEEDAFAIACCRMGQPGSWESEYQKAHPERRWLECVVWMLLGAQFVDFVRQFGSILRGLVTLPQVISGQPGAVQGAPGVFFWLGQYVIVGFLLV